MSGKLFRIVGIIFGVFGGLVIAAFAVYVFLYYPREAESFEINPAEPSQKILIATQGSDFKDRFIRTLCDSLKRSSAYIKGVDVEMLAEMGDGDWDRILIVNTFMVRLNETVDLFVNRAVTPGKILLLVTSGGADWQPGPGLQVDAFTAASRPEQIEELVEVIADRLGEEDGQKWEPDDYLLALKFFSGVDVEVACEAIDLERERYKARYPDLRRSINRIGYQYLRLENVERALEVFRLNVSLFPDAWNVYDSYGEALLVKGDRETAIGNYRKALELNPDSKSARGMLEKLSKE
jgi:tetratricopeptide (TPR) repeat protein